MHAPDDAIEARTFAGRQAVDHFARGVEDFDLQFAEQVTRLLIIGDDRGVGRIIAGENGRAVRPAAVASIRCCCTGFAATKLASCVRRSGVSERSGVMSSMIQMPRPWVARTRSFVRGWIARSRTATAGKRLPLYCAHEFAAVDRDEKPELRAEEKQIRLHQVVLDDMGIAADAFHILRSN